MKTLKLSDVKTKLPFRINTNISTEDVESLAKNRYNDIYDVDVFLPTIGKNLQRPLVWTLLQKQEFILSILKGIKIATISWIRYREGSGRVFDSCTYKIIDGKQRFTTIISFIEGEFPITVNSVDYYYKDLENDALYVINSFSFNVNEAYEYANELISDKDKIAWFEQINFAGTPQDIEHLNNLKS